MKLKIITAVFFGIVLAGLIGCNQKIAPDHQPKVVSPANQTERGAQRAMNVPLPLKTCLFFRYGNSLGTESAEFLRNAPRGAGTLIRFLRSEKLKGSNIRDSWSYFASNSSDAYRSACINSIVKGGGNCIVVLLSNGDPSAPVSFWKDSYGQIPDMDKLALLVQQAKNIHDAGGAMWPCFFCDDSASASIRNVDMQTHARALGLFITLLRPYVPGFIIGLESSEYFSTAQHNQFYDLIKYFAPDRYVLVHMQSVPKDGMPKCDAWCYEASWNPWDGDNHSGAELVAECRTVANKYNKIIWPLEYNVLIGGNVIIEQSKAVLNAGFIGCGGPVK